MSTNNNKNCSKSKNVDFIKKIQKILTQKTFININIVDNFYMIKLQ